MSDMTIGKLMAIIMGIILIVVVGVGVSQGWFAPLKEQIVSQADELLIMFDNLKDKNYGDQSENFCYNELVQTEGKNDFNKSFCVDYCTLNSTDGLPDINIDNHKIYKINITKNSIDVYDSFNSNTAKYEISREYLQTISAELTKKQDLLDIINLKEKLENTNWLDKTEFMYDSVDYSNLDNYRFFSNKSFPIYVSLKYISNNYVQKVYNYLIEYYYNKLFSLEENIELEKELENKINALTEIIINDYNIKTEFDNLDINDIESNCYSWEWDITQTCAESIKNDEERFKEICSEAIEDNPSSLNNFISYNCYTLIISATPAETQNYPETLASNFIESYSKNLTLGISNNKPIKDIVFNSNITEQEIEVLDALYNFKNKSIEAQQSFYPKIESLLNNLQMSSDSSNQDSKIHLKINQTLNISDYYSDCRRWHVENGTNVITYNGDYGIIYNSLDKFEKRQHYVNFRPKYCNLNEIPNNKYFIVEYNSNTKQWSLTLKDMYSIKTLEKEITQLQEFYDLYLFSKESCF